MMTQEDDVSQLTFHEAVTPADPSLLLFPGVALVLSDLSCGGRRRA